MMLNEGEKMIAFAVHVGQGEGGILWIILCCERSEAV